MKRLLDARRGRARRRCGPGRRRAPAMRAGRWRRRLINEALRPAEATADWLAQIDDLREEGAADGVDPIAEGLDGLSLVAARTEEEAADRRRPAAARGAGDARPHRRPGHAGPGAWRGGSRRGWRAGAWSADSSAGAPLAGSPVGALVGLVARAAVDPLDPVTLLAIAQAPASRARAGRRRRWSRAALRWSAACAARPAIEAGPAVAERDASDARAPRRVAAAMLDGRRAARCAVRGRRRGAAGRRRARAGRGDGGPGRGRGRRLGELWAGAAGEAAAGLLAAPDRGERRPAAGQRRAASPTCSSTLLEGETVRAGGASHPRLRILGAIEARLVRADRLILAGLEEGVWPQAAPIDPFLSRPMREAAGPAAAGAAHRPLRPRLRPGRLRARGGPAAHRAARAARRRCSRAGSGGWRPWPRAPACGLPGPPGRSLDWARAPGRARRAPRPPKRPGPTAAGRRAAARAAGHPGRALGARPLRRLRPLHPEAAAAGPAGRAGRGAGARHGDPHGLRALRHRGIRRPRPAAAEAMFADLLVEELERRRHARRRRWRASRRWPRRGRPGSPLRARRRGAARGC